VRGHWAPPGMNADVLRQAEPQLPRGPHNGERYRMAEDDQRGGLPDAYSIASTSALAT